MATVLLLNAPGDLDLLLDLHSTLHTPRYRGYSEQIFSPQAIQHRVIVGGVDGEGSVGHSGLCSTVSKVILDNAILRVVPDREDVLILYLLDGALDDVAAILISIY